MNEDIEPIRNLLSKVPFHLIAAFGLAANVIGILLYVALSPFAYLYGLLCCCEAWIEWGGEGKDVLVVEWNSLHSREWMSRLQPFISGRAVYLNWSERKHWDRGSLSTQLFAVFGPHGMPEQFTSSSLPAAIVLRRLRRPKVFTFGNRSKNLEEKLDQLRLILS